jgi:PAS domain S-box-containing protein
MRIQYSIKSIFTVAMTILLLPSVVLIPYFLYSQYLQKMETLNTQLLYLAEEVANETAKNMEDTHRVLKQLTKQPFLQVGNSLRCDPIVSNLKYWYQQYDNLSVIDRTGQVICNSNSTPEQKLPNYSHRDWFVEAITSKTFTIGSPVVGGTTGLWIVPLVLPLLDDQNEAIGFLSLTLDLVRFKPTFSKNYFPVDTEVSVVDAKGRRLATSATVVDDKWVGQPLPDWPILITLRNAQNGKHAAVHYDDADQINYAATIVSVPGTSWNVVATAPTQALLLSARNAVIFGVALFLLVLVSAVVLARLVLKKIARPMRSIEATANAHIHGDTKMRAVGSGPKELILFADLFNRMLDANELTKSKLENTRSLLHETNGSIKTTIDNMMQGLLMFDANTMISVVNQRYVEMYELSPDVVKTGCSFRELIMHRREVGVFQGDVDQYCDEIIASIADGKTTDRVIETPNGRAIHIISRPLPNGGWVATHDDITKAKQAEEGLRRTQIFLDMIVENMPTPIIVKDAHEHRYTLVNRATEECFGISRNKMIGKTVHELFQKEEADAVVLYDNEALQSEWPLVTDTYRLHTPHNGTRLLNAKRLAIRDSSRNAKHILTVLEDVTERKSIEAQLRQAQKMEAIGNLTGGVAHDFNNLLTIMIGNLDLLLEENAKSSQISEKINVILDAALRGAELTKQMLAFSRRQPLQPKCVDVNSLADKTTRLLARTLGEKIRILVSKSPNPCQIMVDEAQLEAALVNIAINSRDAMPNGGILTITTDKVHFNAEDATHRPGLSAGDHVILKIIDTGHGIPDEIIGHIFEPFFTTKGTGKGTGLGLSMAYGFVKQSGGYIGVTSTHGVETAFELCFPAAAATALMSDINPANMDGGISQPTGRVVLAVDDQPEVRATAVAHLTALGYQVLEANCAKTALDMLAAGAKVDLLFTDIVMPGGLTGIELAKLACAERPDLKVLYTSGYPGTEIVGGSASNINGALLAKPYRKQELAKAVAEILAAA